ASNDYSNRRWWNSPRSTGRVTTRCRIPGHFLSEGQNNVLAAVCSYNPDIVHAVERDAVSFQVVDDTVDGEGVRGDFAGSWPGVVRPQLEWEIQHGIQLPQPSDSQS